jgi:hypothetical protein
MKPILVGFTFLRAELEVPIFASRKSSLNSLYVAIKACVQLPTKVVEKQSRHAAGVQ